MLKRKPKTENEKTEEYFHREVFPMINAFAKECRGHAKQKIKLHNLFEMGHPRNIPNKEVR